MQRKLIESEIEKLKKAIDTIHAILLPTYSDSNQFWRRVVKLLTDKIKHGTNDGQPWVDPELTDQDACQWPRLLVMVRDDDRHPWRGPYPYLGKSSICSFHFVVDSIDGKNSRFWKKARLATPEEIKEAGL